MILCELCKQQPSTLHLTEIAGGAKKELHLCARCAQAKGVTFQSHFSLPEFLGDLTEKLQRTAGKRKQPSIQCPSCGITYAQFRSGGRLGCAEDYEVFRRMLLPFVERIHGSVQHAGKSPTRQPGPARPMDASRRTAALRKDLAEAIEKEKYEEAARIRDEITKLEEKVQGE